MARLGLPCAAALHPRAARAHLEERVLDRISLRRFVECRHLLLDLSHDGLIRRTREADGGRCGHPVLLVYRSLPRTLRVAARLGGGETINACRARPRTLSL